MFKADANPNCVLTFSMSHQPTPVIGLGFYSAQWNNNVVFLKQIKVD